MVFVIQTFVYPENWVEHLTWATMLLFLLTRGPGPISVDRLMKPWMPRTLMNAVPSARHGRAGQSSQPAPAAGRASSSSAPASVV